MMLLLDMKEHGGGGGGGGRGGGKASASASARQPPTIGVYSVDGGGRCSVLLRVHGFHNLPQPLLRASADRHNTCSLRLLELGRAARERAVVPLGGAVAVAAAAVLGSDGGGAPLPPGCSARCRAAPCWPSRAASAAGGATEGDARRARRTRALRRHLASAIDWQVKRL